jgi:uncharacterized protein with HEPN domain
MRCERLGFGFMDDKNIRIAKKIIGYAEKILSYCSTLSEDSFLADEMLTEACVFNIIQIGESTRQLSDDFITKYANIPWGRIRGLRNRIVHDYDGIDHPLIWDIICNDLLDLIQQLNEIVGSSEEANP